MTVQQAILQLPKLLPAKMHDDREVGELDENTLSVYIALLVNQTTKFVEIGPINSFAERQVNGLGLHREKTGQLE